MVKQFSPFEVLGRPKRDAEGKFLLAAGSGVQYDTPVEHTLRDGDVDDRSSPSVSPKPWSPAADLPEIASEPPETNVLRQRRYVPVPIKFAVAVATSTTWLALTTWIAWAWMHDLAAMAGWPVAIGIVAGIALIPGFMSAFLAASLLLDRRPVRRRLVGYPSLSILIAAYNEEASIAETLQSLALQGYPGQLEVIVIDDGSKDDTAGIVAATPYLWLRLLRQPRNMGKDAALNAGLASVQRPSH